MCVCSKENVFQATQFIINISLLFQKLHKEAAKFL